MSRTLTRLLPLLAAFLLVPAAVAAADSGSKAASASTTTTTTTTTTTSTTTTTPKPKPKPAKGSAYLQLPDAFILNHAAVTVPGPPGACPGDRPSVRPWPEGPDEGLPRPSADHVQAHVDLAGNKRQSYGKFSEVLSASGRRSGVRRRDSRPQRHAERVPLRPQLHRARHEHPFRLGRPVRPADAAAARRDPHLPAADGRVRHEHGAGDRRLPPPARLGRVPGAGRQDDQLPAQRLGLDSRSAYPSHGHHAEGWLRKQLLASPTAATSAGSSRSALASRRRRPCSAISTSTAASPATCRTGCTTRDFFIGGYAIHGYDPAPDYPASHGCMRTPIMDAIFVYNWLTFGDAVDVYY